MNVSERYKTIWWLPQRTGARMTFSILREFGFIGSYSYEELEINKHNSKFDEGCHSTSREHIDGYQLISNVRNPYEQIFSLYYHKTFDDLIVVKKHHTEIIRKKFYEWVNKFFVSKKLVIEPLEVKMETEGVNNFYDREIRNWVFTKIPDKVVRIEHFLEDISKIDFIVESDLWRSGKIEDVFYNNQFKTTRYHQFTDIYNVDSARKIYNYYKREFHLFGYDPFSFSKMEITDEEKMKFLHELP